LPLPSAFGALLAGALGSFEGARPPKFGATPLLDAGGFLACGT
jgi:hypothetical protein